MALPNMRCVGVNALGIEWLHAELRRRHGAELPATTKQVVDDVIKPWSLEATFPLRALIDIIPPEFIGPAAGFISHAWKSPFAHTLDCAKQASNHIGGGFVWLDFVAVDQTIPGIWPSDWFRSTLMDLIAQTNRLFVAADLTEEVVVFSRAWCLWEVYCARVRGCQVHILAPQSRAETLREVLRDQQRRRDFFQQDMFAMFENVRVEDSQADNAADRRAILDAVEASGGVDVVNAQLRRLLRNPLLDRITEIAAAAGDDAYSLVSNCGLVLLEFNRYSRARRVLRAALQVAQRVVRNGAARQQLVALVHIAKIHGNIAQTYFRREQFQKAANSYRVSAELFIPLISDQTAVCKLGWAAAYCSWGGALCGLEPKPLLGRNADVTGRVRLMEQALEYAYLHANMAVDEDLRNILAMYLVLGVVYRQVLNDPIRSYGYWRRILGSMGVDPLAPQPNIPGGMPKNKLHQTALFNITTCLLGMSRAPQDVNRAGHAQQGLQYCTEGLRIATILQSHAEMAQYLAMRKALQALT